MRRAVLDPPSLVDRAVDETGVTNLGDDTVIDRIQSIGNWLDDRLTGSGRDRAAAVFHNLLTQRLQLFANHASYSLEHERIEAPLILFGEARSGTTVLQMLLGCDPTARLLEFWEVMYGGAPPGVSDTAQRRRAADNDWREILDQIPRWLVSHPYNAMLGGNPPECERLWAMDFRSLPPTAWWRVPAVPLEPPQLRLPQNAARQYEIHRMMLQYLQYGVTSRRWVLKGVSHQHRLPELLAAYPDATFVWIHRDPLVAIASRFELHAQIFEGIAGSIDRAAFAIATVTACVDNLRAAALNPLADDPRIHHLQYVDVVSDPIRTIRGLYDRLGFAYTAAFDDTMRQWLANNQSRRFGRFTYSTASLGVDVADLDRSLGGYRERFGVPRENHEE